jgi:pimeloyl-ACP methyl ester carboxylesterase
VTRLVTAPDGRTLAVREGGAVGGIPVLVHHGTPGSGLLYAPHVLDAEAKGIHLIAYDRPGYGGSTRHEGRTVADCAADVAAICDALGVGRFCTWGFSGGGPHALATAALLPDRCAAAAALAPVAPWGAEGLDFFEGMGEQNVEEWGLSVRDPDASWASLEREREARRDMAPEQLAEAWATLLSPVDAAALTGTLAAYFLDTIQTGIGTQVAGWFDDDVAFSEPWGFDLAAIRVPVLHLQGRHDRMVPLGHGVWLSRHIAGVESRLDEDGHLTLFERRVAEVHAWLADRYGG